MIFCNTTEKTKGLNTELMKKGYSVTYVTGNMSAKQRHSRFSSFNIGEKNILISTDLASRGIDTEVTVDHVILYDFPRSVIDYIHRVGRTARAGKKGYVTAMIGEKDQGLATKIRVYHENKS